MRSTLRKSWRRRLNCSSRCAGWKRDYLPQRKWTIWWRHSAEGRKRTAPGSMKKGASRRPFPMRTDFVSRHGFLTRCARHRLGRHRSGGLLAGSLFLRCGFLGGLLCRLFLGRCLLCRLFLGRGLLVCRLLLGRCLLCRLLCRLLLRCGLLRRTHRQCLGAWSFDAGVFGAHLVKLLLKPLLVVARSTSGRPCSRSRKAPALPNRQFRRTNFIGPAIGSALPRHAGMELPPASDMHPTYPAWGFTVPARHGRTYPDERRETSRHVTLRAVDFAKHRTI